jgi:hypothetical protein
MPNNWVFQLTEYPNANFSLLVGFKESSNIFGTSFEIRSQLVILIYSWVKLIWEICGYWYFQRNIFFIGYLIISILGIYPSFCHYKFRQQKTFLHKKLLWLELLAPQKIFQCTNSGWLFAFQHWSIHDSLFATKINFSPQKTAATWTIDPEISQKNFCTFLASFLWQ